MRTCWRGARDSNPVGTGLESVALPVESCPPVVRAAGLEPAREPGLSRPPLPIGLRAHGAGGRIRTDKHGGLSSADKPILVRRHNLVARPGFEPGKSLPSEGSAFTNLTSGP